jgi:Uma2 family endonuclease
MHAHSNFETRKWTVDEVLSMVKAGILREDEHVELLEGELVVMAPQGPQHANTSSGLGERFYVTYRPGYVVRLAAPIIADEHSMPEPDLAVFRGDRSTFAQRHPRGDEAVLVVEIARTSLRIDRAKASLYARAGVPVYWLIDVEGRRIQLHEQPQPNGDYALVRILGPEDEITPPGLDLRWKVADLLP